MIHGWLNKVGPYRVEHLPCPSPGVKVDETAPPKGVLHTTEGSSIEGALSVFRQRFAPHFLVGRDQFFKVRVLQLIPLGEIAAALEHPAGTPATNGVVRAQVEIVGFAKTTVWLPEAGTLNAVRHLLSALDRVTGIPMQHHGVKRDERLWEKCSGWLGHADVPNNAHWDPGRIVYTELFPAVHSTPKPTAKPRPRKTDVVRTVPLKARARHAKPPRHAADISR